MKNMSVPFSNNHLRVPRGFGTLMEGLTREILRDQPEDIPKYAAQYFETLLKQREGNGMDPAEWAAKLEDRFYNNHAFKTTTASPEKEETMSKEKSYDSQTEDATTTQPNVSEEVNLTESAEEYDETQDVTEKNNVSLEEGLLEEESLSVIPAGYEQPDDLSGTEEEEKPTITKFDEIDVAANGKDSSSALEQNIPSSNFEPTDSLSFREISNVDVCAQELGGAEEETGGKQDTSIIDVDVDSEGEEHTDTEEPDETFQYSGPADKDVCASEFIGAEETMVKATGEDDDSSEPRPDDVVVQSSVSQSETPENKLHEAEAQVVKTNEEDVTEAGAFSGGLHESLADIEGGLDSNVVPEDSLVEISFEDVPEAQQIKEVEEKQPEEEGSEEPLQTRILEMQQEESKEVAEVARDQIILSTQERDEPVMVGFEKEVPSEERELSSQHQVSDIMEEMESSYSNLNDSDGGDEDDDEKCDSVSSSHQLTIQADIVSPEVETDHKNDDNEKIQEDQDDEEEAKSDDFKEEDEITDTLGGDKVDMHIEGHSEVEEQDMDGGTEKHSSQATQSDQSTATMETETLEARAQHLAEQSESRTPVESLLEDTAVEKESKEETSESVELVEGGTSDAVCEEDSVSLTQSTDHTAEDHQEPPLGPETEITEPEGKSGDKEECSRPQEEEDIMDIPLDDPEANRAAAKIQAGFRGHMTRKKMKPEDKAEGEEVSSTGDVLNGSQGDAETGGSGAVEGDDTSVPEQ